MTQEEIETQAEQYVADILFSNKGFQVFHRDQIKLVFQAGAKWGMEHTIEWHDLRKNPEDLPKIKGDYLCCIPYYDSDNTFYGVINFDTYSKKFYLDEGGEPFNIIAWCELPQFKDKE